MMNNKQTNKLQTTTTHDEQNALRKLSEAEKLARRNAESSALAAASGTANTYGVSVSGRRLLFYSLITF